MKISVSPRKIFLGLLTTVGILTFLNVAGILFRKYTNFPKIDKYIVRLFDFDMEANIPTFYATFALIFAGLLLGYIALVNKQRNKDYKQWMGLCLLFIFLGLDEFASFHELLSGPVRAMMDLDGVLYLAWVIPYGLCSLGIFMFYVKFLFRLSYRVRMMFVLSGFLFVSGAIGFELIGSSYYAAGNTNDIGYALIYTAEELLEMTGITLFIYSSLIHLQKEAVISTVHW